MEDVFKCLEMIHLAEKLKIEKRHSWLGNGDQESVAEHCWRLALMVVLLAPKAKTKINLEKALLMAIIHDLPEIQVGDTPDFEVQNSDEVDHKFEAEKAAMKELSEALGRSDLYDIWLEFENKETLEARFVAALDRMEGHIQHNESDLNTWLEIEKKRQFLGHSSYCRGEPALQALAAQCSEESKAKLPKEDLEMILNWMEGKSLADCLIEVGIKGDLTPESEQSETANH